MHQATLLAVFTFLANFAPAIQAEADSKLSYGNSGPQLNVREDFFAIYIGIWRGFDLRERQLVSEGAALISQRDIRWQVLQCETNQLVHKDAKVLWTFEPLELDGQGKVLPIREAQRADFRYFSKLNIHGLYLKGAGGFTRPPRVQGDNAATYRERLERAKQVWRSDASLIGSKGKIEVSLDIRLLPLASPRQLSDQFLLFSDYQTIGEQNQELFLIFHKMAPNRWPVHYDERAHKLHSFHEPRTWREHAANYVSRDLLRSKVYWDWCDEENGLDLSVLVPIGEALTEGPNRNGRAGGSQNLIAVEEVLF